MIAIVGFQAEHTLGRRLVEGMWSQFGIPTPRRAQVVVFNGLSAHADRNDPLAMCEPSHRLRSRCSSSMGRKTGALTWGCHSPNIRACQSSPAKESSYDI